MSSSRGTVVLVQSSSNRIDKRFEVIKIAKKETPRRGGSLLWSSLDSSFRKGQRGPPTLEIRYARPG
ncbi:hypothetical protein HZH68_002995 [Vespula germanica]|uniref:Uncharacterized protein n=1 Tax=Vespula germanica TaxID=30212 RepID=A0A834U275_VESGE|nr:hypothetical protein HZH68_002995 [Vespula germanica]